MSIHDKYTKEIKDNLDTLGTPLTILNDTKWTMLEKSDYLLDSETYLELGTIKDNSLSFSVCSSEFDFEDKIVLIGNDINSLSGKVENYAKVVMVNMEENEDTNTTFKQIKEIERIKHSIIFSETMLKASSIEGRECFRISKTAHKNGFNFSIIGSELIKKLKSYDYVKSVAVYFIVDKQELIYELKSYPNKINMLTEALNHIFDDIILDCESCAIKEVCDEVDGMRESHRKMHGK